MPVTATEIGIRFQPSPRTTSSAIETGPMTRRAAVPDLARDRGYGLSCREEARRRAGPQLQELSFAAAPGSDMRPYDRLIGAALDGDRLAVRPAGHRRGRLAGLDPVLGDAAPVHRYARGSWGPKEAAGCCPTGIPGTTRRADPERH